VSIRQYELVYIVSPESTDQQVTDLHTQVEEIIGRFQGQLEKTENWGRRKLAYEIGRHKEGTYVLEVINGSGDLVKEIDRRLKVSDQIIRHMIVRVDQDQRVVERTRAKRQADTERRRVARGLPPQPDPSERKRPADDNDLDDTGYEGAEG
jgi:small subunit ribosomal protein S6